MPTAVAMAVDHCLFELGLHRVTAGCFADNTPSWRVMERIGMRREAELRESHLQLGEWRTELIYAALRSDRISAD